MLFFQTALLAGYVYAHWLARRLPPAVLARVHLALLLVSLALLPVIPAEHWKPRGDEQPIVRILLLLGATVGLPYMLLASTSPLLQSVWARSRGGEIPYRWYALSNAGSLLGLLTYPVLIEPLFGTRNQAMLWSASYVVYAALIGWVFLRSRSLQLMPQEPAGHEHVPVRTQLTWVLLPAAASALLLTATAYITENIAPVPLVWVLPLSAYLLSFILCFGRAHWYRPALFMRFALAGLLGMAALVQIPSLSFKVRLAMSVVTAGVFLVSMYCHGEVVRRRPSGGALTRFYLSIAAGGALGGFLIGVAAPLELTLPMDFPLALLVCALALFLFEYRRGFAPLLLTGATLAVVLYVSTLHAGALAAGGYAFARSFYGTLRISEEYAGVEPVVRARVLTHGVIHHGSQLLHPELRKQPTMYFGRGSGVHLAIEQTRRAGQRVGVIGLGTGSLAAWGREGDVYRFYEINPQVLRLATTVFSYLSDSPARVEVSLGDARLVLEREPPQNYDVFVLDAFSSDALPAHLLTREAIQVYLRHLAPGGVLAVHISNKVLDLEPVVAAAARAAGLTGRLVERGDDPRNFRLRAKWVLLSRDPGVFDRDHLSGAGTPLRTEPGISGWTDDYSNVWKIMR